MTQLTTNPLPDEVYALTAWLREEIDNLPDVSINQEYSELAVALNTIVSMVMDKLEIDHKDTTNFSEELEHAVQILMFDVLSHCDKFAAVNEYVSLERSLASYVNQASRILKEIHSEIVPELIQRTYALTEQKYNEVLDPDKPNDPEFMDWTLTEPDLDILENTVQKLFARNFVDALDKNVNWFKTVQLNPLKAYEVPDDGKNTLYCQAAEVGIDTATVYKFLKVWSDTAAVVEMVQQLISANDLEALYVALNEWIKDYSLALTLNKIIFDAPDDELDEWADFTHRVVDLTIIFNALLFALRNQLKVEGVVAFGTGRLYLNPDLSEELVSDGITSEDIVHFWWSVFSNKAPSGIFLSQLKGANLEQHKQTYLKEMNRKNSNAHLEKVNCFKDAAQTVLTDYFVKKAEDRNADDATKEKIKDIITNATQLQAMTDADFPNLIVSLCIHSYDEKVAEILSQIHYSVIKQINRAMDAGVDEFLDTDQAAIQIYARSRAVSKFLVKEIIRMNGD